MKLVHLLLVSLLALPTLVMAEVESTTQQNSQAELSIQQCAWPLWQRFKDNYIKDGRVVDDSESRDITTSEGQSYGMFFALVANDQKAFDSLLEWTEINLSDGDLTAHLPSWLWGTLPTGEKGILDYNTASDSDLWIAYNLVEAGRLWDNYYYQTLGYAIAARILKEETIEVDNYGTVLLPGRTGFVSDKNHVRLNPSYLPMQLLVRMQALYPDYQWQALIDSSNKLLLDSMPMGFSPDWVEVTANGLQTDTATQGIGSYNAIRTYLWAGLLSDQSSHKAPLIKAMQPLVEVLKETNAMPETLNANDGSYKGNAGLGLTAAITPLLMASGETDLAKQIFNRTQDNLASIEHKHYYQSVLMLFAQGWMNKLYQFDAQGRVIPHWLTSCQK